MLVPDASVMTTSLDMPFHSHGNSSLWAPLASSSLAAAAGRRFQDFVQGPQGWLISVSLLQFLSLC